MLDIEVKTYMKINCRFEGGAGDCLLAARFLPAIKEKHPDSSIHIFVDSAGKSFQADALKFAYGHLFDSIEIIGSKKYDEFWVNTQFGADNFYGALENVPDVIRARMTQDCDKFYDLHIDGLKWTTYDFDWLRYFYFFPAPRIDGVEDFLKGRDIPTDYVVAHLHSATSVGHRLEPFYVEGLLERLSKFTHVVVIATDETKNLYPKLENVTILIDSVENVFRAIKGARAMVSTDSGFRYIAYGCGVPTITFSANCYAPNQVPVSHMVRWLMFTNQTFPLNYSFTFVAKMIQGILKDKGAALAPYVQNYNNEFVNRDYRIIEDRCKLAANKNLTASAGILEG